MNPWVLPFGPHVPTNTKIWVHIDSFADVSALQDHEDVVLEDADGNPIATNFSRISLRGAPGIQRALLVLSPKEPLAPNSHFLIRVEHPIGLPVEEIEFDTGDGPDLEPPPIPKEVGRSEFTLEAGSSCGEVVGASVRYEADPLSDDEVDIAQSAQKMIVAKLSDFDDLDTRRWSGTAHVVVRPRDYFGDPVVVGFGKGAFRSWPEEASRREDFEVGAFDVAGNFSGFTARSTVTLPKPPSDCSVGVARAGGQAQLTTLVLSLMGMLIVRRVKRKRPIS